MVGLSLYLHGGRVVQSETVRSMDGSTCVMGIERLNARPGFPSVIRSDIGINFVATDKELLAFIEILNQQAPSRLVPKGMKWKYNPPSAPHHGGSRERLARTYPRAFHSMLEIPKKSLEVLDKTFCLVEQFLEYVPCRNKRAKSSPERELKTGHFVWTVEPTNSRGSHHLACIRTLNASLKFLNGDFTCPVTKLAPVLILLRAEDVATQVSENLEASNLNDITTCWGVV